LEPLVTERIPKLAVISAAAFAPLLLLFFAYSRPAYFSTKTYLGGLLFLEFLFVALAMYRRVFFPLILLAFLSAGAGLPLTGFWISGRWVLLSIGAGVGAIIALKDRRNRIGSFHMLALFSVLGSVVSAAVCRYTSLSLMKVFSLLLLFVYGATGVRLAVTGRENRFFPGLLVGCEIFVAATAICYLVGYEVMGNPNSLGAVIGVALTPILLWGSLLNERPWVHNRRLALCVVSLALVFHSHARAAIAAAFVSCAFMCVGLRRYKLLAQGLCVTIILVAASVILDPQTVPSIVTDTVYKGRDAALGVLDSRTTPWQGAIDSIHKHFWFGSGFGVTDNGQDATPNLGSFHTDQGTTRENGSSYLTVMTWVGMVGVIPFFFLLLVLLGKIARTFLWMWHTENQCHPAIPLAMVVIAGLIHAGFEDWLFAPGYYLCVFFWSVAFILIDVAPWAPFPSFSARWRPELARSASTFAPSR
jgi:O-antigen ligase